MKQLLTAPKLQGSRTAQKYPTLGPSCTSYCQHCSALAYAVLCNAPQRPAIPRGSRGAVSGSFHALAPQAGCHQVRPHSRGPRGLHIWLGGLQERGVVHASRGPSYIVSELLAGSLHNPVLRHCTRQGCPAPRALHGLAWRSGFLITTRCVVGRREGEL